MWDPSAGPLTGDAAVFRTEETGREDGDRGEVSAGDGCGPGDGLRGGDGSLPGSGDWVCGEWEAPEDEALRRLRANRALLVLVELFLEGVGGGELHVFPTSRPSAPAISPLVCELSATADPLPSSCVPSSSS